MKRPCRQRRNWPPPDAIDWEDRNTFSAGTFLAALAVILLCALLQAFATESTESTENPSLGISLCTPCPLWHDDLSVAPDRLVVPGQPRRAT